MISWSGSVDKVVTPLFIISKPAVAVISPFVGAISVIALPFLSRTFTPASFKSCLEVGSVVIIDLPAFISTGPSGLATNLPF